MDALVKVEGLAPAVRKMKALDAEAPREVRALNRRAGETAAAAARPLVPLGETGQLLKSVRAGATLRAGYVMAGSAKVPYAGARHFGWPAHNIEGVPFLTEGLGDAEPRIVDDYDRGFTDLIRRVGL